MAKLPYLKDSRKTHLLHFPFRGKDKTGREGWEEMDVYATTLMQWSLPLTLSLTQCSVPSLPVRSDLPKPVTGESSSHSYLRTNWILLLHHRFPFIWDGHTNYLHFIRQNIKAFKLLRISFTVRRPEMDMFDILKPVKLKWFNFFHAGLTFWVSSFWLFCLLQTGASLRFHTLR